MFFTKKYKKIISIFLVTSFLIPSLFLTQPQKVEAVDTVTDPGNTMISVINMIKNGISVGYDKLSSAASITLENKEMILDGLAWTAAKLAIRQMTTSIVTWINNGFEGSPAFVTDFQGMLIDVADQVIGEYIEGTDLAFLCDSFSIDIKLALWNTFYDDDGPTCTVSDIISNAGGALTSLQDDFRWGTWIEMTNETNNNAYGAYLQAESNMLDEIYEAQDKKIRQTNWGEGFLSWENCENVPDPKDDTGAVWIEHCETQTPGSVIASKLNHTLGLGEDSLVTADEFNEILGALLMQLAKSVMSSVGLLGQSNLSSYGGSQNLSSIQNTMTQKIDDSLAFEREYNGIKNDSLNLILMAKDLILDLIDCLSVTNEPDKLDAANRLLTDPITFYQPAFTIDLYTLETNLRADILDSDNIIFQLNLYIKEINEADSADKLNEIMTEYSALAPYVHNLIDISDAEIERDGYGSPTSGLAMGISYDINLLITTYAPPIDYGFHSVYPPEASKGLQQRYNECQICKSGGVCTVEGSGF